MLHSLYFVLLYVVFLVYIFLFFLFLFFFKQKTAYEIVRSLEFRRVLFRSRTSLLAGPASLSSRPRATSVRRTSRAEPGDGLRRRPWRPSPAHLGPGLRSPRADRR